ncbi:MAG TPA: hypothetical protein DF699_06615 [Phycisphaerales bacterium]|nr:hypothetical protein [Phycisphaerales bacterium]
MPNRYTTPLCMLLLCLATLASRGQTTRPIADRLDAIVSYPLVMAVQAENERSLAKGVTTRIDDGRTFVSDAFWVGLVPYASLPAWTTSPGGWEVYSYEQIRNTPVAQRPPGSWFISVALPIDAVGQGLWFGQERYELNWLPDPERSLLEADSAQRTRDFDAFWSHRLDDRALRDPAVSKAIEQYQRDPFQNWRARLLLDGLDPSRTRARETLGGVPDALEQIEHALNTQPPADEMLAGIARQQEARWQIILGRIWLIDPSTAERMKHALMRTASFGDRRLPLWSADTNGLARLAHDLLSPFVNDDTRVLRAKAWLEAQPRALSWIIDDQGQLEAGTDRLLPTLGVVSLPSTPGDSLLRIDSLLDTPDLSTVPPNQMYRVQVPVEPRMVDSMSPVIETVPITMRIGRWSAKHELIASRVPARAPFVRIGPLLNDWDLSALVNNQPLARAKPPANRATIGLLQRSTPPSRNDPLSGWQLYLECAAPNPGREGDAIEVWIGPRAYPIAAWRITPDALVETIASSGLGITPQPSVETRILNDRWVAQITLPDSVFDEHADLVLGIERTDADGVHTAWPRRMIPGQSEPARLIITPDEFDNLRLDP